MSIHIPYGKGHIECNIPYDGLLTSRIDTLKSDRPGVEIVREAVLNPIGSKPLRELTAHLLRQFSQDKLNRGVSAFADVNGFD